MCDLNVELVISYACISASYCYHIFVYCLTDVGDLNALSNSLMALLKTVSVSLTACLETLK
jgi:hypothetical protein